MRPLRGGELQRVERRLAEVAGEGSQVHPPAPAQAQIQPLEAGLFRVEDLVRADRPVVPVQEPLAPDLESYNDLLQDLGGVA